MKKNRLPIISLILLSVLSPLGAVTVDEIIEEAKNNSPSYQNYLLTYQNGLLAVQALEEEDKVGITVSATIDPLTDVYSEGGEEPSYIGESGNKGITVNPSFSVILPNDGATTITGSTRLTSSYKDGSTSISGSLGVSHTFDFSSYDSDNAENLNYASTKYNTELTYRRSELTFEKSVLNTISQILSMENSIMQSEYNVEKQQKALDKIISLGSYSTTSSTYINTENVLVSYQQSLEALEKQYDNLLASYKTLTGLEWNGVDVDEAPTLTLTTYENGNTSVIIESLNAESAEETYKKTVANANPSSLSTSLSMSASSNKIYGISGSLTYSGNNWNVSVKPGVTFNSGNTTPTVTVSGSWRNNSGASAVSSQMDAEGNAVSSISSGSSNDAVNSALNNAKMAANSYLDALSTYNENAASYSLQILEYNNKKVQKEAELEYQKTLLENEQTLYDLGLSTSDSLKSAQINYSISQNEWKMLVIEGLSLQCDLDIFAL